jgi:hypothetical protein
MAFYLNPRGIVLPKSVAQKIGVPLDTQWIIGTQGDDTFTFTKLYNHVVISLGGKAAYNGAATMTEPDMAIYYSFTEQSSWNILKPYLKLPAWKPATAKEQIYQIGGHMDAKGDGPKKIILHGGHYDKPARGWLQPGDKVHVADDKLGADDIFRFTFEGTRKDFDGKGMTAKLKVVELHGEDSTNQITDGQKFTAIFNKTDHYRDASGHDNFKYTWVDWDHAGGPNKVDVWHAIDEYFF